MNNLTTVSESNLSDVLREIEDAFWDIPFGNTDFQCENFVIAAAVTPERAYRTIGLQIHGLLTNLQQVKNDRRLAEIEIAELEERIASPDVSKFDKMRAQVKLETMRENSRWSQKLVMDAIRQLNVYYKHFKAFPRYSRAQFENGEARYFEQTQRRQVLGITGAKESIINMVDDMKTIENFERAWAALPHDRREEMLERIAKESMAGMIEFNQGGQP